MLTCDFCSMPDDQVTKTDTGWNICPRCMVPLVPTDACDRCGQPVEFDLSKDDKLIYSPPHYEEVGSYRHGACCGLNDCPACGDPVDLGAQFVIIRDGRNHEVVTAVVHPQCSRFVVP